jgi:hypothetical protein
MRHRNLLGILLFCLGLLAIVLPVKADTMDGVTFSLVNANLSGSPGDILTWDYNVSNASGVQILGLFVNGDIFSGGTPIASAFDDFGHGPINNGASLQGALFSFQSDPVSSTNSGEFTLTVLLEGSIPMFVDLHADYSGKISPANNVPEPATLMLLASGLLAGLLIVRRTAQ